MAAPRPAEGGTTGWAIAKTMLLGSLVALLVAIGLAFTPLQNPGVQDCGTALGYIVFDRPDLQATPGETPGSTELALQPTCRERVVPQLQRAALALAAALGLGILGAIIGLIDDRIAYRRAPKFETLLRERPAEAPGRYLRPPPVLAPAAVGRALPPVEGRDVALLGGIGLAAATTLVLVAGTTAFSDALGATQWLLVAVAVAVQLLAVLAASGQDVLAGGGRPAHAGTVAVASGAASRLLPPLGPLGYDLYDRVWQGAERSSARTALGRRQTFGLIAWLVLGAAFLLVARTTPRPEVSVPPAVWGLVGAGVLFGLVGLGRALDRWRRLLVPLEPVSDIVRAVRDRPTVPTAVRIIGQSAAALAVPLAGIAALALTVASSGGRLGFATVAVVALGGMALVAVVPTPAGIGGVEVSVTAALVLFGVPVGSAAVAVLLWRLVTLWLPLAAGLVPFRRASVRGAVLA